MAVIEITDESFSDEVEKSELPVLVDFWAEWCGPCRMIAPIVEELSDEYDGKMKFCKVDVDSNSGTAGKFGIRSIPTLLLFKNGQISDQVVGSVPKENLKSKIDGVLAS